AFHYSAITCDDCVVNFIDRILADETWELRSAFKKLETEANNVWHEQGVRLKDRMVYADWVVQQCRAALKERK
ncbi:hypothetical protein LCGC14_2454620, partial [marine sediment metagenome]